MKHSNVLRSGERCSQGYRSYTARCLSCVMQQHGCHLWLCPDCQLCFPRQPHSRSLLFSSIRIHLTYCPIVGHH